MALTSLSMYKNDELSEQQHIPLADLSNNLTVMSLHNILGLIICFCIKLIMIQRSDDTIIISLLFPNQQ